MKVYLINPKFPVTYWGFEYSNDLSGNHYTSPPLGLATVAALTPSDIEVQICDENIEDVNFDNDCDIVGLTGYLIQGPRAFDIAAEFQRRGKTVVMGGPITSLDPETCAEHVDVVFRGEAEYTWKRFLDEYQAGAYKSAYIQTEKIDMRDSPVPRFDLMKIEKYSHAGIQTTRGCPFNCEFCDIVVLFGRKVRCKDVSQVIAEMREVARQPIDSIFFTDDNFVGNRKYAKKLLQAIIEFNTTQPKPLQYMTQVSVNLAQDEELMQLFYEARMTKVFVGVETPRKASLQEANKGQNVKTDLVADIKNIQSYNIDVSAGMIVGFDHDDADIFQEQLDFIMETNISWTMTGILQAVPKTPLYERLKRENRLDLSSDNLKLNNTALNVNIIPKNMTKEELIRGYHWLLKQLYSYENYGKRVIGTLQAYTRESKTKVTVPSFKQLKVVLRTLRYYWLTWDRSRRKFSWDILKYVILHKPDALYDAMVHLVSFKHLHTFVYDQLEKAVNQQVTVVRQFENSVNCHADAVSKHALTMYEELKKQAAMISKQATNAYEELGSQATNVSKQAASEYEELRRQAAALQQQATAAYEELRQHAAMISKHTVNEYGELRKQAVIMSERVSTAYDELRRQAAVVSQNASGVSKHAANVYGDLGQQARLLSQASADLRDELEKAVRSVSPVPAAEKH